MEKEKSVCQKLLSRKIIWISFLKLIASTILALALNTYWKTCSQPDEINYFCTYCYNCDSSDAVITSEQHCNNQCSRFGAGLPEKGTPYGSTPYFYCNVPNSCMCNRWLLFSLTIILANLVHFVIQVIYSLSYDDFDPQQITHDLINSDWCGMADISVFLKLFHPRNCLLALFEAGVIVISIQEFVQTASLAENGQNCDQTRKDLSHPIVFFVLITMSELLKANIDRATNAWERKENPIITRIVGVLGAMTRLDIMMVYSFTIFIQACIFALSLVTVFPFFYFKSDHQDLKKSVHEYELAHSSQPTEVAVVAPNSEHPYDVVQSHHFH